jgi:hypothetical protein
MTETKSGWHQHTMSELVQARDELCAGVKHDGPRLTALSHDETDAGKLNPAHEFVDFREPNLDQKISLVIKCSDHWLDWRKSYNSGHNLEETLERSQHRPSMPSSAPAAGQGLIRSRTMASAATNIDRFLLARSKILDLLRMTSSRSLLCCLNIRVAVR